MKCKWHEIGMCDEEATEMVDGKDGKQLPHCRACAALVRALGVEMILAMRGSFMSGKNAKTLLKEYREKSQYE